MVGESAVTDVVAMAEATLLHFVPSKCRNVPPSKTQMSLAESAEMAVASPAPKTGLETVLQLPPFQCSTKTLPRLPPTAQTLLGEIAANDIWGVGSNEFIDPTTGAIDT